MEPEQSIQEDEEILNSAHPSMWSYFPLYLISIFITFATIKTPVIATGVLMFIVFDLHRRGNRYFVTSNRVIREFRFLKRDSQEASTDLISDVLINQSLNQRLLGIGDVHVKTASGENIEFRGVNKPGDMKSEITDVKNKEKNNPQKVEIVEEDTIKCLNCGEEVSETSDYCSNCGANIQDQRGINTDRILDQTIKEIKDDAQAREIDYGKLIDAEEEGKDRKTLIKWLEKQEEG